MDVCEGARSGHHNLPPLCILLFLDHTRPGERPLGPPCPWFPDCTLLLPHLDQQVSQHPSACLWLLTGSDKGSGVEDAPGHGLPLTLSPGGGSSSSPAESETVCWRQSGKVTWGRNTDPRLSSGAKIVFLSGLLGLAVTRRWARSLLLDGADARNRTPCLRGDWRRSQIDAPMWSARSLVWSRTMQGASLGGSNRRLSGHLAPKRGHPVCVNCQAVAQRQARWRCWLVL